MRLASVTALMVFAACTAGPKDRNAGQTDFISAPYPGQVNSGGDTNAGGGGGGGGGGAAAPGGTTTTDPTRTVEETDLYRLDGNRLYYLDGYRGLMVFDVTNPDAPQFLGRSPIFGSPVDMYVSNGIAVVVVADWYDVNPDGSPFYGSVVRGLDATDPTNIKVLGDTHVGGWVEDDRIVGNVIYTVAEDWGQGDDYGWGGYYDGIGGGGGGGGAAVAPAIRPHATGHAPGHATGPAARAGKPHVSPAAHRKANATRVHPLDSTTDTEDVVVTSVSFANNQITPVSQIKFPGFCGVFYVNVDSIMLAHPSANNNPNQSDITFLDITDPNGRILQRGSVTVDGDPSGFGPDNGRFNLDFEDTLHAHMIGAVYDQTSYTLSYVVSTADFTNPDAPAVESELTISQPAWSVVARFDSNRLYLSPDVGWYDGSDATPFQVYDLSTPTAPALVGTIDITGDVWNILPAPQSRLFALGNDYESETDAVTLQYLDVTNAAAPVVLSSQQFGQGWAWTPAAGTFKAFTMDTTKDLVVLPYSGWDDTSETYNNGLQLVEFTDQSETVTGAAHTKGWTERGIFVGTRLYSLADMALAVVDYTNPQAPTVITELTLARNVYTAQPVGSSIAEVSSDWWGNDNSTSEVRLLPIGQADETTDVGSVPSVTIDGVGAQVFTNGALSYVVTDTEVASTCPGDPSTVTNCWSRIEKVTVVDASSGTLVTRGSIQLPPDQWGWWGWGWWGFWWDDWFDGGEIVQVENSALAFRRWEPQFGSNGAYLDSNSDLYVVDLSNPDVPKIASETITTDPDGWWGNMQVVAGTLYTTHEEWVEQPSSSAYGYVRYWADRIDLSDRSHPVVEASVNVPGFIVGGDPTDPTTIYTIDYRWDGDIPKNDFDVLELGKTKATLKSHTTLDGWVGNTVVSGTTAYMSTELYDPSGNNAPTMELHAIDASKPEHPVDRVASGPQGWGWLLGVQGDRALVTSGWSDAGIDIYQLQPSTAPVYQQTVRTLGWWANGVSRQGNQLFISSGYWGVQTVNLN